MHNAALFVVCAIISGGLSGANFPMTAALVADYYGETNNAINYGSIYAFKALGGSFAGGLAALIMTGTLYGTAHFALGVGVLFGAALGALAAVTVTFLCKRPTEQQMERPSVRQQTRRRSGPSPPWHSPRRPWRWAEGPLGRIPPRGRGKVNVPLGGQ